MTSERTVLMESARRMVSSYCEAREAGGKPLEWEQYDRARDAFKAALGNVFDELERLRPLLALAKQYASECSGCDGTGNANRFLDDSGIPSSTEDCEDCADIRAAINKAEGRV